MPFTFIRSRIWSQCCAVQYLALISVLLVLVACDTKSGQLAMIDAQPKTPAQRNHTPFYGALQCMDDLFGKSHRNRRVAISAAQILDRTDSISVGTRDMIITALNHMTRRSKAFTFVEQGLVRRSSGDILELEAGKLKGSSTLTPVLYISGAISQVDDGVRGSSVNSDLNGFGSSNTGINTIGISGNSDHSIVTLDLHLVRFPSRAVIPGTSINNSIVVSRRTWNSGLAGVISQRTLGLTLKIERVESEGQAVRSLIELGLIEMLGNYTGVPFWKCLSAPEANAQKAAVSEKKHIAGNKSEKLKTAQYMLKTLGYGNVQPTGKMDEHTKQALSRFQAQQFLLINGTLDFDTFLALDKAYAKIKPKPKSTPIQVSKVPSKPPAATDDGFQSLQVFVDQAF